MIKWSMSPSSSHTNGWKVWSDMERSLEAATLWNHFRFMPKPRQLAKGRTKISEKCDKVFFFAHFRSGFPPCMWNITFIYIFACCCFLMFPSSKKTMVPHPTQLPKNCIKVLTPTGVIIFPIQPMPLFQGELPQNYHACLFQTLQNDSHSMIPNPIIQAFYIKNPSGQLSSRNHPRNSVYGSAPVDPNLHLEIPGRPDRRVGLSDGRVVAEIWWAKND